MLIAKQVDGMKNKNERVELQDRNIEFFWNAGFDAVNSIRGYHEVMMAEWSKSVQWMGIEPTTSAVLKPRHNQLDHLCTLPFRQLIDIYTLLRY